MSTFDWDQSDHALSFDFYDRESICDLGPSGHAFFYNYYDRENIFHHGYGPGSSQ